MQSARTVEEGKELVLACLENTAGMRKIKRIQRNVSAIIYKLVHFGFGSTWQPWAISKAKAGT